jgi:hypothetical protein
MMLSYLTLKHSRDGPVLHIEGKARDLLLGVVAPTLVALLIIAVGMSSTSAALIGLKYTLLEAIVIVGVPMLIGLIWNQWAGGASGFLLGSIYALYYSDQLYATQGGGDVSLLANLVSAMLIGYIAGSLNKRSASYRHLMFSGVTAGVMGAVVIVIVTPFSEVLGETSALGLLLPFLPRIFAGLIVPFLARVFLQHTDLKKGASPST